MFGPCLKRHQRLSYRQALLSRLSLRPRRSLGGKKSDFSAAVKAAQQPSRVGVALLLSVVYGILTSYDMCWRFLRALIYSIILWVEVAYRLASDAPLSWVTQRTLKRRRDISECFWTNGESLENFTEHSLSPRALPSAPPGPAFQGLQVCPEFKNNAIHQTKRIISAAAHLTRLVILHFVLTDREVPLDL